MARVYKSICAELDELTVKILCVCEKHVNYKLEVERLMNNGFINIAKSRYIMGTKCVSTLQFPSDNSRPMAPILVVNRTLNGDYWEYKPKRNKQTIIHSEESILKQKIKYDAVRPDVYKSLLEENAKSIRKRNDFYLVEDRGYKDLNDELQDNLSTDSSDISDFEVTYTDPIRMFGILVPLSLRVAQKNFQDVLDVITMCATTQSEIESLLKRYYHLKKVKKFIEDASKERQIDLTLEKHYWTPSESSTDLSAAIEGMFGSISGESILGEDQTQQMEESEFDKELYIDEGGEGEEIPDTNMYPGSTQSVESEVEDSFQEDSIVNTETDIISEKQYPNDE
ncbi:UNVERIFIED_CONTAM: hypothetical protein PYX00_003644 [Menopon gallinae]|uniref:Vacuolar ATPase assembly protein VMA22 n=1 Tax=Menopon gallinae TaxID=328185 RepID=A0AAW2I1E6_9NEOP